MQGSKTALNIDTHTFNRGTDAVARITVEFPTAEVNFLELDLTDKQSIENFAVKFNKTDFV